MIGVVDYEAGNLTSVANALKHIGASYVVSDKARVLDSCDSLIFPGVGHAAAAMDRLKAKDLVEFLRTFAQSGRWFFGICLGSQIVLAESDEIKGTSTRAGETTACLNLCPGRVKHFSHLFGQGNGENHGAYVVDGERLKVPQIGWNAVTWDENDAVAARLFDLVPQGAGFYFDHSFYTEPLAATRSLCSSTYGKPFAAGVTRDNIIAVQFHPEKSGRFGLQVLRNFITLSGGSTP